MSHKVDITPNKTYKTVINAERAAEKFVQARIHDQLRYFVHTHVDGRFFPVFIGANAITAGVHFHFNVIA